MERSEAISYFQTLGQVARITADRGERAKLYEEERNTASYIDAFKTLRPPELEESFELDEAEELEIVDPVVQWAQRTKSDYQRLIVGNSKERSNAKRLLVNGMERIVTGHMPIREVLGSWKSSSLHEEGEDTFYKMIVEMLPQVTRDNWMKIGPEALERYLSLVANGDLLIEEVAELIKTYVNAPKRKNDCAQMYYTLAQAAVLSSSNPKTLELAIRLGTFATDALPFNSAVYMNLYRIRQGNTIDARDDEALKKYLIAKQTFSLTEHLTHPGQPSYAYREGEFVNKVNKAECDRVFFEDVDTMRKRLPEEQFEEKRRLIKSFNTATRSDSEWPSTLENDPNDPLNQLFQEKLADRVLGKIAIENSDQLLATVPTPDGKILYIQGDKSLKSKIGAVIRFGLNHPPFEELKRPSRPTVRSINFMNTETTYDGKKLQLIHRFASGSEESLHPLQVLDFVGVPEPMPLEEIGKRDTTELSEALQRDQIRFINLRGLRIPLNKYPELKSLGYSALDFKRNPNDSSGLSCSLMIGDTAYDFNLNRYFLPDLKGKTLLSFENLDRLTYIVQQLLYPILCNENDYEAQKGSSDESLQIISRMGHLRWLPEGQRFSKKAVNHCREFEDRDLYLVNLERMDRNDSTRESTYVRPVIAEDDSLPPITVRSKAELSFI